MKVTNDLLTDIDIFRDLSTRERNQIVNFFKIKKYSSGKEIISQKSQNRSIYLIISGKVKTVYLTADKETIVQEHSKGEIIGILSLADKKYLSAATISVTRTVLLSIGKSHFRRLLQRYPGVSYQFNMCLVSYLGGFSDRIIEFCTLDVNSRIRSELLRIIDDRHSHTNSVLLDDMPTHSEMASKIGTHREAVTRELKHLESKGIIERKWRKLKVLNIGRLKKMVAEGHVSS